jgi:hypothetical protein
MSQDRNRSKQERLRRHRLDQCERHAGTTRTGRRWGEADANVRGFAVDKRRPSDRHGRRTMYASTFQIDNRRRPFRDLHRL